MADVMPVSPQRSNEIGEQCERVVEWRQIGDLAADMHVDTDDFEARKRGSQGIDFTRAADRDAELVLGLAGGDLAMGLGVDIGVDAHARRARAWPFR